ncbi:hypothetical protein TBR22_A20610 [Luteitalea sp. TBR-22]|uniref:protein-disulfide reductase DsbD domain-containing protein n=1 Tax=Luteitalea sp. TBR-22 TaxID=2802971 RepID=UPI001AF3D5C8|nr:protein-disulfide reductase DsbD domain-containing protein [Luteitalea sp. TBR-22]BCS32838.1 hypothetical protein TBR22_A20610 [Luteitalea sp. TBR-22]
MRVLAACALLVIAAPLVLVAQGRPGQPALVLPGEADLPEGGIQTRHLQAQVVGESRVGPDGTGSITLAVTPSPRMHIYAHDAEGYTAFRLEFESRPDLVGGSHAYPASEISVFAPTGETSNVYTRPFRVTRGFTVKGRLRDQVRTSADGVPITLLVRYQACDDRVCYRAEQRSLTVRLRPR